MPEQKKSKPTRVKLVSAIVGGSAVVAMGALAVAIGPEQTSSPPLLSGSGSMQTGVTITTTTPPTVMPVPIASPTVKAPRFGKS